MQALTRVATPASEEGLLELASSLTASQLERALRAYRRVTSAEARESHELEYVDYYWAEDGSLVLRARLTAEDGTVLVKALDVYRQRAWQRRREEAKANETEPRTAAEACEPPRSPNVDAIVELAKSALAPTDHRSADDARVVVHVDAAALMEDARGRCELEHGPDISSETARRLSCDAEQVTQIERDGLPLSVGRKRRTVPPTLRRLVEARDSGCCRFPGCERRVRLQAHHRAHWAQGGETSLDNLILLCFHHHRFVHEGGYTIEDADDGDLRFRNRYGVLQPSRPPRLPPGSADALLAQNLGNQVDIDADTNRNGYGDPFDLALAVDAVIDAIGRPKRRTMVLLE